MMSKANLCFLLRLLLCISISSRNVLGFFHRLSSSTTKSPLCLGRRNAHSSDAWRQQLPFPLNEYRTDALQGLTWDYPNGDQVEVVIIGSVHYWNQSGADVSLLLETEKPDIILIESCEKKMEGRLINSLLDKAQDIAPNTQSCVDGTIEGRNNDDDEEEDFIEQYMRLNEATWGGMGYSKRSERILFERISAKGQLLNQAIFGTEGRCEMTVAYDYWKRISANVDATPGEPEFPLLVMGDIPYDIHSIKFDEALRKRDHLLFLIRKIRTMGVVGVAVGGGALGIGFLLRRMPWLTISGIVIGLICSNPDGLPNKIESLRLKKINKINSQGRNLIMRTCEEESQQHVAKKKRRSTPMERVVLDDRDTYMACKLWQSIQLFWEKDFESRVLPIQCKAVAIVGQAHVQGMTKALIDQVERDEDPSDRLLHLLRTKRVVYSVEQLQNFANTVYAVPEWWKEENLIELMPYMLDGVKNPIQRAQNEKLKK